MIAFTVPFMEPRWKARSKAAMAAFLPALFLFALNAWVCWRLFNTEYLDQMHSIEGAFLSLATYIERRWRRYDCFPEWYAGMPFTRTYQPGGAATTTSILCPGAFPFWRVPYTPGTRCGALRKTASTMSN